ncbi:heterokaryon incompatibility protein-domain-containing protein [Xylariaceae sp. FL0255]|nr:heterokaryon incompatibility protein-domain-containing protein [Xylariaceae sp. FL0255]
MKCAKCTTLNAGDFAYGQSQPFQDSLQALKTSAQAGCDFCKLCWACCLNYRSSNDLDYLLAGLGPFGEAIPDPRVFLEGLIYPSRKSPLLFQDGEDKPANSIWLSIGTLGVGRDISIGVLSIFADPDTPAANTRHKLCSPPPEIANCMPTRLIDVGSPKSARLIVTSQMGLEKPYVALSYCWGLPDAGVTLLETNFNNMLEEIPEEFLSKTHKDAFQLTRELGYQYIWIDTLCIIQQCREDWRRESRSMAQVYSNAALTIVAGRASDSRDGFLENKFQPQVEPVALPFYDPPAPSDRDGSAYEIWASLPRRRADGAVSNRGWCFQEAVLCSRALLFGTEQLNFRCREFDVWEDGTAGRPPTYQVRNKYSRIHSSSSTLSQNSQSVGIIRQHDERQRRMLIYWYRTILTGYTRRSLANEDDIFAALSGLAQDLKPQIRSRYLAGHEVDLVRSLLWYPWKNKIGAARSSLKPQCYRRQEAKVPSWCWAAVVGQIHVETIDRYQARYDPSQFLVRRASSQGWTKDLACHATEVYIESCELRIIGRPARVQCSKPSCIYIIAPSSSLFPRSISPSLSLESYRRVIDETAVVREEINIKTVGVGCFDIPGEMVEECWCLALTRQEGLILNRNKDGSFYRLGMMVVADVEWVLSNPEIDITMV